MNNYKLLQIVATITKSENYNVNINSNKKQKNDLNNQNNKKACYHYSNTSHYVKDYNYNITKCKSYQTIRHISKACS